MREIIIGSRGSDLALWQANFIQAQLQDLGYSSRIHIIVTKGDRIQHLSFDKIEGKGFFTKEIEDALLAGEIDLAVHSLKDLPTTSPAGLTIGATSYREDPRDLLLIRPASYDAASPLGLQPGAIVGTSSARRKVQVKLLQEDVILKDLRGNVPTRIQKCRDGEYDAILLAAAGVSRLRLPLDDFIAIPLAADKFVPAPAQGVLGLQIRENDSWMHKVTAQLHRADVAKAVEIERNVLHLFDGGCHMPVGVYCEPKAEGFELTVAKSNDDSQLPIKIRLSGTQPSELASKAVFLANQKREGKIFISRERSECSMLAKQLVSHGYEVICASLIETSPIPFEHVVDSDWLFFVSRNAATYFLEKYKPKANVRIAAVGEGTARAIAAYGLTPDFIGEGRNLQVIAGNFVDIAQNSRVLFPIGNRSKRTIQQYIQAECQVEELVVYANHPKAIGITEALAAAVLTSPSSAEAFLQANQVGPDTLFVAMGSTTADQLLQAGVKNLVESIGFRQDELAMTLFSKL